MKYRKEFVRNLSCTALIAMLVACGDPSTGRENSAVETVDPPDSPIHPQTVTAQSAINSFATALKAELTSAMQQGGPLNAIQVCNTSAPSIAEQVSLDQGVSLSRVSLRTRNPSNTPLDWQRPVLESFEQRKQSGEDSNSLDWSEMVVSGDRQEFRYMKAIPTAGICLQCHGENISPQVSDAIGDLYPDDQATGYREGDIRGAFVVISQ